MKILLTLTSALLLSTAFPQQTKCVAGPMLGYIEMREAMVWVMLDSSASVVLQYWPAGNETALKNSHSVLTSPHSGNIAHLIAGPLEPYTEYDYRIMANGKEVDIGPHEGFSTQIDWKFHGNDSPPDFKIAFGSCNYVNERRYDRYEQKYGGEYQIFEKIVEFGPKLMIWLGDNTYYREADHGSWSGILARNVHTRSNPQLQRLLRSTHHYATWDDHDFGPNNSNRTFRNAHLTKEAFELFWPNPISSWQQGISCQFSYGDVDFFLLDNRTYRSSPDHALEQRTILGETQIDLLLEALRTSKASFKIIGIGGQFLSPLAEFENYANYAEERAEIIQRIDEYGINGVIFLSGDRHAAELTKVDLSDGRSLYDLTSSPLTSGISDVKDEVNPNRVEGTYFQDRNFGSIEFSGKRTERKAILRLHDNEGKIVWERMVLP